MKTLFTVILLMIAFMGSSQTYLGVPLSEIKINNPTKKYTEGKNEDNTDYAVTSDGTLTYLYMFDIYKKCRATYLYIEDYETVINILVLFNQEYEKATDTSWRVTYDSGFVMDISFAYNAELKSYYFAMTKH